MSHATSLSPADAFGPAAAAGTAHSVRPRIQSIDALRGFVMIVMLLDHVRENWFLHHQVPDPIYVLAVDPGLFFTRLTSTICAPVFVALTGLGAWLHSVNHSRSETASFLVKRGLFLMLLDVTLITFVWTTRLPPTIWLQVIWCIGISMIALAALMRLPRNVYGDAPWVRTGDPLRTTMSFLALTKYPPSLLFLLPTLGLGSILLALIEHVDGARVIDLLAVVGSAPMFFYVLHLCVLRALYHMAYFVWGPNHGSVFGVDSLATVWAWYLALIVPLYFPTAWFSRLKSRRRDIAWLKYF